MKYNLYFEFEFRLFERKIVGIIQFLKIEIRFTRCWIDLKSLKEFSTEFCLEKSDLSNVVKLISAVILIFPSFKRLFQFIINVLIIFGCLGAYLDKLQGIRWL